MVGSMYSGIAGLRSHLQKLNVIGNNVANCNTFAFKSGRMTFQESLYTTINASTGGTNASGGINAAQIGYGSKVGTIDLNMAPGSYTPSTIGTNCMLKGNGFFMVGEKSDNLVEPQNLTLTRYGDFTIDSDGYLVDGNGNVVYGFIPVGDETTGAPTGAVNTCLTPLRLPLRAKAGLANIKEGTALYPGVDTDGITTNVPADTADGDNAIKVNSVMIDKNGKITATNSDTKEAIVMGYIAIANPDNPNGLTKTEGAYYRASGGNEGRINVGTAQGVVTGRLNGNATDKPLLGAYDDIYSSALESSNADISTEFSEMITTQRGFQANTKIITVTDAMLEELVNMKR